MQENLEKFQLITKENKIKSRKALKHELFSDQRNLFLM